MKQRPLKSQIYKLWPKKISKLSGSTNFWIPIKLNKTWFTCLKTLSPHILIDRFENEYSEQTKIGTSKEHSDQINMS